jgi:hypothetical protein
MRYDGWNVKCRKSDWLEGGYTRYGMQEGVPRAQGVKLSRKRIAATSKVRYLQAASRTYGGDTKRHASEDGGKSANQRHASTAASATRLQKSREERKLHAFIH